MLPKPFDLISSPFLNMVYVGGSVPWYPSAGGRLRRIRVSRARKRCLLEANSNVAQTPDAVVDCDDVSTQIVFHSVVKAIVDHEALDAAEGRDGRRHGRENGIPEGFGCSVIVEIDVSLAVRTDDPRDDNLVWHPVLCQEDRVWPE